jgi:hypothetical protein
MKLFKFIVLLLFSVFTLPVMAQSTGGAKGKVRDPKGNGLGEVMITARQDGNDIKSVKSDNKGNFEINGLKPGIYNFVFEKTGYSLGVRFNVEIKGGSTVDLGDRLILQVDRGTLVLIQGSVFNQDGRSVSGAKVELERINSDGSTKKLGTVYTNISGEFSFRQPDSRGKFRVTATARGVRGAKEVEVEGAAIYRTAITLNFANREEN